MERGTRIFADRVLVNRSLVLPVSMGGGSVFGQQISGFPFWREVGLGGWFCCFDLVDAWGFFEQEVAEESELNGLRVCDGRMGVVAVVGLEGQLAE